MAVSGRDIWKKKAGNKNAITVNRSWGVVNGRWKTSSALGLLPAEGEEGADSVWLGGRRWVPREGGGGGEGAEGGGREGEREASISPFFLDLQVRISDFMKFSRRRYVGRNNASRSLPAPPSRQRALTCRLHHRGGHRQG